MDFVSANEYNKLFYRDALSVKILSTAEASCTTNSHIGVTELAGYSWQILKNSVYPQC